VRFTKVRLPDGNVIIDTGLPQKGIKPVGLNLLVDLIRTLFAAMAVEGNMENGIVRSMSKGLVNMIFDMSKRDEALENINRLINEELGDDGGASLDFTERTRIESDIWMEIALREMAEHMDGAFGISHRLAIGTFGTASTEADEEGDENELPAEAGVGEEWRDVDAT